MYVRAMVLLLFASACSDSIVVTDHRTDKVEMLRDVDDVYHEFLALADRCSKRDCESRGSFDEREVTRLVDLMIGKINDPDVLFRLAVMSFVSAYPQDAGMQAVDSVFDAAWRGSVHRLGSLHNSAALEALRSLDDTLKLDGGGALILMETIQRAERNGDKP